MQNLVGCPDTVAVYCVRVAPPSEAGVVQLTGSFAESPEVTWTLTGAPGVVDGVPVPALEAALVPAALVAVTVTLYITPFVSPVTVQLVLVAGEGVHVFVV